jgi:hypothetical protein
MKVFHCDHGDQPVFFENTECLHCGHLLAFVPNRVGSPGGSFDRLIDSWFPVTYVLNNLNRGLGLPDAYPFVLSTPVLDKLRFVHDIVAVPAPDSHSDRPGLCAPAPSRAE